MAAVGGGGGAESGSSSDSTPLSKEQQSTEGRRLHAVNAPEASRPHVGLGIGDFAVMGKLGEGGYGTVLLARHKTTHLMYAQQQALRPSPSLSLALSLRRTLSLRLGLNPSVIQA